MNHEEFAEQVAQTLESMAKTTAEEEVRIGYGITAMRANELRVAAHVVRDLSQVETKKEASANRPERLPPYVFRASLHRSTIG